MRNREPIAERKHPDYAAHGCRVLMLAGKAAVFSPPVPSTPP